MDIPQINVLAPRSASLVDPLAATRPGAVALPVSPTLPLVAQTTVDLSPSGRFLSLASLFQKKTLDLQSSIADESAAALALDQAAVAATAVAGVFNELQTTVVPSTGLPAGELGEQSLEQQFFQFFADSPDEADASLAGIGLQFTSAPAGRTLEVDEAALKKAFAGDPAATSAKLERAASALFQVVGGRSDMSPPVSPAIAASDGIDRTAQATAPADAPARVVPPVPQQNVGAEFDMPEPAKLARETAPISQSEPEPGPDPSTDSTTRDTNAAPPNVQAPGVDMNARQPVAMQSSVSQAVNNGDAPKIGAAPVTPPAVDAQDKLYVQNLITESLREAAALPENIEAQPAVAVPDVESEVKPESVHEPIPGSNLPKPLAADRPDTQSTDAADTAQAARLLAQQLQAEQTAARALDEKIANASDAVRAALAEELARRDAAKVDAHRAEKLMEQRRTAHADTGLEQAQSPDMLAVQADLARTAATADFISAVQHAAKEVPQAPIALSPAQQALQAARDPAIAAAIAGFNMSTGAFAAQNAKPELQPPKPKTIAPVAGVTKVAGVEPIGTSSGGATRSRQ